MAESKSVSIVPLNGDNYATWKVQCRMALVKDGLWNIVNGKETLPEGGSEEARTKFEARRDRALALVVLSLEPSLLYLIGDPQDPVVVWKLLSNQFQKKTWANRLRLRRRLHSLKLNEGGAVQEHIRQMTEIFQELAVVGDPVGEEDRVVYLLASLPESYDMVVTAFEANSEVPKIEVVTERLLNHEKKQKDRKGTDESESAMAVRSKEIRCYYCKKLGHIKRNCSAFKQRQNSQTAVPQGANVADDEGEDAIMVTHALKAGHTMNWIVDSGATCHMCANQEFFVDLQPLGKPMDVTLGDGRVLQATGRGLVTLSMRLPGGSERRCNLLDVLYVPALSYNLLSVSRAAERGYFTEFDCNGCQISVPGGRVVAKATRVGCLYHLDCKVAECAGVASQQSNENLWHQRYGHLNTQSLRSLFRNKLVTGLNYDSENDISFCEACVRGKHAKAVFPHSVSGRSEKPLDLVHSDVCGKLNSTSWGGAEYFLTFIDDCTHYTWTYVLKRKSEVFDAFLKWKALVERSSGQKLRAIRTDNGGEYVSTKFNDYLESNGIRHELTVPKTPQQNGTAERMNRTLVETVRSMMLHAGLPNKFWAEALSTATYLKNRSPTKAVENVTPYEAWTGEKPDVSHLRVFGCDAYAHIPKDERRKLDAKSRKCILVGYGETTKGYRLFDPERGKVCLSRDVIFNERSYSGCGGGVKGGGGSGNGGGGVDGDFGVVGGSGAGGVVGGSGAGGVDGDSDTGGEEHSVDLEPYDATESPRGGSPLHNTAHCDTTSTEMPQTQQILPHPTTVRRSTRQTRVPDYYARETYLAVEHELEPKTLSQVLSSADKHHWMEAMEKEMKSLHENRVWELVKLPVGRKPVGSKWVFKLKTDEDGNIERYKARLVAQGYTQKFGMDYDETFCPVARLESVRTLMALSVQHKLHLHQIDVTTAFLNGNLEEEVYMRQPEGFVKPGQEHLVCKLKRSLYGLKQAPRCWNMALHSLLKELNFVQLESDPCIYRASNGEKFFLGVYVDDILMVAKNEARLADVKKCLSEKFDIKDLGRLHHFLGMKIIQDETMKSIWVGQQAYTEKLLQCLGMENARPVSTPVDISNKLVKASEDDECVDWQMYQSAVGSLLYLAVSTRPDISYAVSSVAKFSAQPTKVHWSAVKRILRYLRGTPDYGLAFSLDSCGKCVGYSDADWGGDLDDRKSTSGYIFFISGGPVSWRSKKQSCVALSTAEAEYIALSSAVQEATWMGRLTSSLEGRKEEPVLVFEDNQSTISMSKNPQFHGRSKHIGIKYHFVRDQVEKNIVELKYCPTESMIADIMTKGLSREKFLKLRAMAGVVCLSSGSE